MYINVYIEKMNKDVGPTLGRQTQILKKTDQSYCEQLWTNQKTEDKMFEE